MIETVLSSVVRDSCCGPRTVSSTKVTGNLVVLSVGVAVAIDSVVHHPTHWLPAGAIQDVSVFKHRAQIQTVGEDEDGRTAGRTKGSRVAVPLIH